jgi:hypothetical protein
LGEDQKESRAVKADEREESSWVEVEVAVVCT